MSKRPNPSSNPARLVSAKCLDLTYEGKGVIREGQEVIFVAGMFPGDEGVVEVDYRRNGQWFGHVRSLSVLSKDRVEPRCKISSSCGGCCFQAYAYQAQLQYKANKVKEQFRKVAHLDVAVEPTLGMENPYFYRNKIQMPFAKDQTGHLYCGFYKEGTHVIVPVEQCYIEDQGAATILQAIKELASSFHIEPYLEDARYGLLRHVLIRTSYYQKQVMVVLVTTVDSFPSRNNFVHALLKKCPEITTVVQNINSRSTNVILGEQQRILYGTGHIEDSLCDVKFQISAKSFYQTNPPMTEVLYQKAMEAACLQPTDVVLDSYSGIGTIGLIASRYVKKVISVEIVPEAVRDAINNAKRNNITNFQEFADDASSFIARMAQNKEPLDVLFMDPPRKGSDERFLKAVLALKPKRIVYVSCDPSTLARDVGFISKSYAIQSIQPVDMFPMTDHVETVVALTLRDSKK